MANDDPVPSAAPGDLELVRSFVNTLDIEAGTDLIGSPSAGSGWLRDHGSPGRIDRTDLAKLVTLRESLRDLVSGRGTPAEVDAIAALEAISARHPLLVRFSTPKPLEPTSKRAADAFIERVLAIVVSSMIDGSWERLKTCANDGCRWLFYDHSRNHSRSWCAMGLCGSRAKMRAYRRRQALTDDLMR